MNFQKEARGKGKIVSLTILNLKHLLLNSCIENIPILFKIYVRLIWGYRDILKRGMSDFLIFGVKYAILTYFNSNE